MAAITTRMGTQEPLDELTEAYSECAAGVARGLSGLGEAEVASGAFCPTPGEVMGEGHAGLTEFAWVRAIVLPALEGRHFRLVRTEGGPINDGASAQQALPDDNPVEYVGRKRGWSGLQGSPRMAREYRIELVDAGGNPAPLPADFVPFAPMTTAVGSSPLLSWTSKLGAWSFSLPAGHTSLGGACPGAAAGQSPASAQAQRNQSVAVTKALADYPSPDANRLVDPASLVRRRGGVDVAASICQTCYATSTNYTYTSNIVHAYMRWLWQEWALKTPATDSRFSNMFVQVMVDAIDGADDYVEGYYDPRKKERGPAEPPQWLAYPARFFRIHDAGDFVSLEAFKAWVEIANAFAPGNSSGFTPVVLWVPTRMWAMGDKFTRALQSNPAKNLVVRPSAYELNQHAPDLGGACAAGTTVYANGVATAAIAGEAPRFFDWDCHAYAALGGKLSCRDAPAPDGQIGCRACWMRPELRINYRSH